MKKILYTVLILLSLLGVVIVATPASWVVYKLQQALPNLQVANVAGSAWRGQLGGVKVLSRGYSIPLGRLTWQIQFFSLLRLQPCATFSTDAVEQNSRGQVCINPFSQQLTLSDAYAEISAPVIAELFAVEISGRFDATIEEVRVQADANQQLQIKTLDADVIWKSAEFNNSEEWIPLGELLITLGNDPVSGAVNTEWSDNDVDGQPGPLAVNLTAQLSTDQRITIDGTLQPRASAKRAMHQTLNLIGERDGRDVYRIDVKL